ncbi:MAG TPA: ATP synthase F0 subunit B [Vicinamibacterales bacterium]|nr:ATP synthase F0 subunit B [Vicinamibacterales bacterium]
MTLLALLVSAASLSASPQPHERAAGERQPASGQHAQPAQPEAGGREGAVAEAHTAEAEHEESLLTTLARVANFAILVGALAYFLRSPIAGYLRSRGDEIRAELVQAGEMRRTAELQLAEVDRRMQALPGELDALRTRGAEEIAAEEQRIRSAADAERARLLEQMRRDVELQVRIARRALMEEAAALATSVARERITSVMTQDDQLRLIDRYATQLGGAR